MNDSTIIETLAQVKSSDLSTMMQEMFRGVVFDMFLSVMDAEVSLLCGVKYHPDSEPGARRAGSAPGSVFIENKKVNVSRPRVRDVNPDGSESERMLETYIAGRDPGYLKTSILNALIAGVSTREQTRINPDAPVSKSQVSRLWIEEGKRFIDALRNRDLSSEKWIALLIDGLELSSDVTAVAAMGVTLDGRKIILDFQIGASENYEVCRDLLKRVHAHGFAPEAGYRLFCVIDGSKALEKAVKKIYPGTLVQRCQIHKERNIKRYLSKRDWGESSRLFSSLRKKQGEEATTEVYEELKTFLKSKNAAAYESLLEAGDNLLTLQKLGAPATLNVSFLSTNIIENPYRNVRRKLGRVCRFRAETDQANRWMAMALLEAERGFRRIRGYKDLPILHELLRVDSALSRTDAPSSSDSKVTTGGAPETSPSYTVSPKSGCD